MATLDARSLPSLTVCPASAIVSFWSWPSYTDYGKLPCPMKSYSAAKNLYPWIEYACNKDVHGMFNVAYNNLCTEMLDAFGQYYLASNA